MQFITRNALIRLAVLGVILGGLLGGSYYPMMRMPGRSYRGPLPPLTAQEAALRDALRRDVEMLAGAIGERNVVMRVPLAAAADYIEESFTTAGYTVSRQSFAVGGTPCDNLEVEVRGARRAQEIVVIGGHYDSVIGCPGANDNATGVAAVLALARAWAGKSLDRTLRFVAFVNEEPPFFQTEQMGSLVYARRLRQRAENVVAMLSLETLGCYSDVKGSQRYPYPLSLFYPDTGNFIGFVGDVASRGLVREIVASFRRHTQFPSEGAALPGALTGVGWSDHWSFWQQGYPGVMVTDTAPFRYPYYHTPQDTPEKIDYDRMARVVAGLENVVGDLTGVATGEDTKDQEK